MPFSHFRHLGPPPIVSVEGRKCAKKFFLCVIRDPFSSTGVNYPLSAHTNCSTCALQKLATLPRAACHPVSVPPRVPR